MTKPINTYIAHRACGFGHEENTQEAFRVALRSQADEVELDLRRTADGRFLASHWPLLLRTHASLMALETILELAIPSGKGLRLDLKTTGGEEQLLGTVKNSGYVERTVFMSQNTSTLLKLHKLNPHAQLSRTVVITGFNARLDDMLYRRALKSLAASGLNVSELSLTLARLAGAFSDALIEESLKNFRELAVCIHSPEEIRHLHAHGVLTFLSKSPIPR